MPAAYLQAGHTLSGQQLYKLGHWNRFENTLGVAIMPVAFENAVGALIKFGAASTTNGLTPLLAHGHYAPDVPPALSYCVLSASANDAFAASICVSADAAAASEAPSSHPSRLA